MFETTKDLVLKLKNQENCGINLNFIFSFFRKNKDYFQNYFNCTPILILDNINLYSTLSLPSNSLENIM